MTEYGFTTVDKKDVQAGCPGAAGQTIKIKFLRRVEFCNKVYAPYKTYKISAALLPSVKALGGMLITEKHDAPTCDLKKPVKPEVYDPQASKKYEILLEKYNTEKQKQISAITEETNMLVYDNFMDYYYNTKKELSREERVITAQYYLQEELFPYNKKSPPAWRIWETAIRDIPPLLFPDSIPFVTMRDDWCRKIGIKYLY